ncbi:cell division protein FtsQ/DivIB [Limnohabitans sp.]|jgi:cell division protein FtsQ|uniref:cell division protein FtsQ/DivIB n=1 Tax=Limnohabitans sp. TaxID=1907725 RepID=UPI0035AE3826
MKVMAPLPFDIRLMNKVASLMLTLFVLVCLASGLWWVLRHPSFALQLITVEGEVSRNNALTLKTNVVPQLNGNFFTLELERARQAFEAVPWVRSAVVHREFPNRLRVRLQEQHPVALWGEEGSSTLVNEQGQVFEANLGEVEADALPRLKGPVSQSQQVLAMYQTLRPVLQGADMDMDELELSPRGSWKVVTSQGVTIELGRGQPQALTALLQDFLRTLPQITSRYGRTPKSLAAADLRHKDGYALRLQGVTTTEGDPRKKP